MDLIDCEDSDYAEVPSPSFYYSIQTWFIFRIRRFAGLKPEGIGVYVAPSARRILKEKERGTSLN